MNPEVVLRLVVILVIALILFLVVRLARNFRDYGLRVKIVLGILITTMLALALEAYITVTNTATITESLSGRLETSVSLLAEEQLINTLFVETDTANHFFEEIANEMVKFANYWSNLERRQATLGLGTYWDASASLFQLEAGHYGNSASDVSSVYVPAKYTLSESLLADLNTSAYLDFYAPEIIETNPTILAVYGIDTRGVTRYYPNIELASLLPPDFDPTTRPYYEITAPLFNPQKTARWSIPYIDAAGGGLVVTVAAPVYVGDEFRGIVAADMQLGAITQQIEGIRVGQTGYAFMLDDAGHIISMPEAGYQLFDINLDEINPEEYYKVTALGHGPEEIQAITNRMVSGGSGLVILPINDVDTYVAFAPIETNGYSVGIVIATSELQGAIITARNETQRQVQSAALQSLLILGAIILAAVATSLGIGRIIATPILQLTQTAKQIDSGDLSAQTRVTSRDEIGTLAKAFNTMTSRLRETLAGLEQRVADRTSELTDANQQIEQRAAQLETIARVAHAIGSTRDLDELLPQIAAAISKQFGFYHVGIFLLDQRREYAVLSAANSAGGKKMLANNHKLKVGETGIVGFVTATGKPRVALDTGADAVFFNNPFLPDTRSEIALPLLTGQEVIGALDVQSAEANAFGEQDINILSILADQVSVAIQNAIQSEQTQKALAEAESLSRQLVRAGWREYSKGKKLVGIRHSGARATFLYAKRNGKQTEEAKISDDEPLSKPRGASLSIPIKLRGEVIGTVDVRAPGNRRWDQDEMDIVSAIIERAALALENARFLEESRKRVAKEQTIGEISAKISAHSTVEDLIRTAALELSRSLPGAEVAIHFNRDQETE